MSVAARVIEMAEGSEGARRRMLDKVNAITAKSRPRVYGHDILVAIYNRADQKTAGGIIVPGSNREDEFQGKVGMVVALGPMCSEENSPGYEAWFGAEPPKVGDWVILNTRDGFSVLMGDMIFRLVEWKYLRLGADTPDGVM